LSNDGPNLNTICKEVSPDIMSSVADQFLKEQFQKDNDTSISSLEDKKRQ